MASGLRNCVLDVFGVTGTVTGCSSMSSPQSHVVDLSVESIILETKHPALISTLDFSHRNRTVIRPKFWCLGAQSIEEHSSQSTWVNP